MNPTHDQNVSSIIERFKGENDVSEIKLALRNEPEVQRLAQSIDDLSTIQILEFGREAAVEISHFSDQIVEVMRRDDIESSSELLKQLGKVMDRFDKKDFEKNFGGILSKLFKKSGMMMERMYNKYQSMGKEIEQVYIRISKYKSEMEETTALLERMYEQNHQYYLTLEKYVVAAELKLSELKTTKLPQLEKNALNDDQMSSLELDSIRKAIGLLEQRIHDLGMVRMIALQTAPQIKLLQRGHEKLIGKINSAFVTTIPIFKNGLIQAVTAKRQKLAAESMKELDLRTKEVLIRNVRNLAAQSVDVPRQSGSTGIRMETLEECFHIIIKGMKETRAIEEENKTLRDAGKEHLKQLQENYKNSVR